MKKKTWLIYLVSCITLIAACLSACSNSYNKYFLPEINCSASELTIEYVNNLEGDYVFPLEECPKLNHSDYEQWGSVESAWLIKDKDGNIVGWLQMWMPTDSKDGEVKHGLAPQKEGGKWQFVKSSFTVYIPNEMSLSVFDKISFTCNVCDISFENSSEIYSVENKVVGVSASYALEIENVDPSSVEEIKITLNIS